MGPAENSFAAYVLGQLAPLRGLGCRAMFGGYGLYRGPTFFGIIFAGQLYFKTDETTVEDYIRHGTRPFQPNATQVLRTYYEVPTAILEDRKRLLDWAAVAAQCAAAASERPQRISR
jgi:DNA transformation protein and related proteins